MRTTVFVLTILGSIAGVHAQPAYHFGGQAQPRAEGFYGLQEGRSLKTIPHEGPTSCNGGACTLSGGPSGGPNQS